MEHGAVCRPLGHLESVMYDFLEHGSLIIVYNLSLSTNAELDDSTMMTSLTSMWNIFPMLRMSIVETEGVLLFKEMEKVTIDYARVEGDRLVHHNDLLNKKFNKEGPLWRVRLLERVQKTGETKSYAYDLLISWFHSITDGTSNIRMCNRLAEVIDSTLEGETVNSVDEVTIKPPIEAILLSKKEYTWAEVKPLLMKKMKDDHSCTLWGKTFPANKDTKCSTKFVDVGSLDEKATKELVKRCKDENVTVNGALTVAINIAVYNFLKLGGADGDTLPIKSILNVNLRRFFEDKNICGLTIANPSTVFATSSSSQTKFWQTSREASSLIHQIMNSEDFLKEIATVRTVLLNGKQIIASDMENPITNADFSISNMCDVTREFAGVYRNLNFDWISRSSSICYIGMPCLFNTTTFRGKLLLSVDCNSRYMSTEQGLTIAKDVLAIIKTVM